MIKNLVFH